MGLKRVSALRRYDYPDYAYDVVGWAVRTELDGAKVGEVEDLVVTEEGEPRYLDVDLGFLKKHVLIPLERAHADPVDKVVLVERLRADDFKSVPPLTHDLDDLTLDYERRLSEAYRTDVPASPRVGASGHVEDRLVRLGSMDGFRVRGDEDPRGWKVIAGDGTELGKTVDLVIDRNTLRAAYLLASIDEKGHDLERIGRHALIPIERVRLTDNKRVLVDGLFARDLARYPVYGGLPIETSVLDRIESFFDRLIGADAAAANVTTRQSVMGGPARHPRTFFGTHQTVEARVQEYRIADRETTTGVGSAEARGVARPLDRDRGELDSDEGRTLEADHPVLVRDTRAAGGDEREGVTVKSGDSEIRIRLRGDDIVIERQPPLESDVEPPPA